MVTQIMGMVAHLLVNLKIQNFVVTISLILVNSAMTVILLVGMVAQTLVKENFVEMVFPNQD